MIISKTIETKISNQGSYYLRLGYPNTKQGTILDVKVEDLAPDSNKKVLCECDDCKITFLRPYQSVYGRKIHRCKPCNSKYVGSVNLGMKVPGNCLRCGPLHPRWNPNKKEFKTYSGKVHWLTSKNYKEHEDLINPLNLPRTLCGVEGGYQLDHKISILEGFMEYYKPEWIARVENLQMLSWEENLNKRMEDRDYF